MEPLALPLHFGNLQGKHEIKADSLLVFIDSYKEIAEFFGLNIDVQIGIPQEGGWKTNLILTISFFGANPFIALLTGETADDWAKKGHTEIVRMVNDFVTKEATEIPEEFPKECVKQKNHIYQQFQKDGCIDSFRLDDLPPIPRKNFDLYIQEIVEDEPIYLGETDITVHSPDWKGKRSWRGEIKILDDVERSFAFDKDLTGEFWEKIKLDLLPLHTTDTMTVQLIKRPTQKVQYQVIRVLSYNGEEIDSPVDEEIIRRFATIADHPVSISKPLAQQQFDFSG